MFDKCNFYIKLGRIHFSRFFFFSFIAIQWEIVPYNQRPKWNEIVKFLSCIFFSSLMKSGSSSSKSAAVYFWNHIWIAFSLPFVFQMSNWGFFFLYFFSKFKRKILLNEEFFMQRSGFMMKRVSQMEYDIRTRFINKFDQFNSTKEMTEEIWTICL